MGELNRMTQFKDKSIKVNLANGTEFIPTGLFMYPILMASDILLYDVDFVVVGQDQKQHVELTRDIAIRMNKKYNANLFKETEPLIPKHGAKIMDLVNPTIKMSKSNQNENGTIFLDDDPKIASKKIMAAKTDSLNKVHFDFVNQPGISNLMMIYSCLSDVTLDKLESKYVNKSYGDFKKDLATILSNFLVAFQSKYQKFHKDIKKILDALKTNAYKCNEVANAKLQLVYKTIGLIK
jgi:tryptophanyl-tRNA synthetase